METIIRKVKDINSDAKRYLESVLGRELTESQQIIIRVIEIGKDPDEASRQAALDRAAAIAGNGHKHAAAQNIVRGRS